VKERTLVRPSHRRKINDKNNIKYIGREWRRVGMIHLAQDRDQWRIQVCKVINFLFL
jgi:hypothetical protein